MLRIISWSDPGSHSVPSVGGFTDLDLFEGEGNLEDLTSST